MKKQLNPALPLALALSLQTSSSCADTSPTLTIWVFPHDELSEISDEQLQIDYFDHWLLEMRQIVDIPVLLTFHRDVPGLTDVDYTQQDAQATLALWADASWAWRRQQESPGGALDNKYLLLTRNSLGKDGLTMITGAAHQAGHAAIASLLSYAAAGHELGHTLSATHEQSAIQYNGWFCETYMYPKRIGLRSQCYRYSDENRANIANYLKKREQ